MTVGIEEREDEAVIIPAEVFHPSVFIKDEMDARGWSLDDLAVRMGGDFGINRLSLDLYFEIGPEEPDLLIGDGEDLARAFGVSAEYFLNLERAWREHPSTTAMRAAKKVRR